MGEFSGMNTGWFPVQMGNWVQFASFKCFMISAQIKDTCISFFNTLMHILLLNTRHWRELKSLAGQWFPILYSADGSFGLPFVWTLKRSHKVPALWKWWGSLVNHAYMVVKHWNRLLPQWHIQAHAVLAGMAGSFWDFTKLWQDISSTLTLCGPVINLLTLAFKRCGPGVN
jgi:hypothetical protein